MRNVSLITIALIGLIVSEGRAQVPPFFGGGNGVIGYDPEISVVNTGVLTDVQVVVSQDRRYVTINGFDFSQSRLQSLDVFQAVGARAGNGGAGPGPGGNGGTMLGYVGNAGMIGDDEPEGARAVLPSGGVPTNASPTKILQTDRTASASVLRKEGMFKISVKR